MYTLKHNPPLKVKDDYFYIRTDKNKAIDIAKRENNNFNHFLNKNKILQQNLYKEIESRENIDYDTYPFKITYDSKVSYFYRNSKNQGYVKFYRIIDNKEELLIDINEFAKDKSHCDISIQISQNDNIMGYCADYEGNELYTLFLKDLKTGKFIENSMPKIPYADFDFSPDSKYIYYIQADDKMWCNSVWRYCLETQKKIKVFQVTCGERNASYYFSADEKYIVYSSSDQDTSDQYFAPLDYPTDTTCISQRLQTSMYQADISGETILIRTNINQTEFRLVRSNIKNPTKWFEYISFPNDQTFETFSMFNNFTTIYVTTKGHSIVYLLDNQNKLTKLNLTDGVSNISEGVKYYDIPELYFKIESNIKPPTIKVLNLKNNNLTKLWSKPIHNYNENLYKTFTLNIPSFYGEKVPVTCIARKDVDLKTQNIYLYGYGAYSISLEPYFSSKLFSIIDRGYIYAIAHVRGGSVKGNKWYLDGKIHNKMNSFLDLITVAEYFKKESHRKIILEGRSAGGLLVGASMVMRPDLFDKVILGVPFVDIIASMSDANIPLTEGEYTEWGNPHNIEDYIYMKQYSPIDNIRNTSYPSTLILGGISDPRVQYWEPIKFHQKLLDYKTDANQHFLKIELGSGHFGNSDKFKFIDDYSKQYTFMLS
uniref:Oligopeptidase B n=1 Tax=viral metagenome TaxID=1070528 RepID=A0A6C0ACJ9_9ZZZZ